MESCYYGSISVGKMTQNSPKELQLLLSEVTAAGCVCSGEKRETFILQFGKK